jgi:hypothetical protein
MRQVRISEDVGLAAFAQYEQRVNDQLRARSEAQMAQALAAEMESDSVEGLDDLGRKGGFFKKLVKFHKKLSPVSLFKGKKRGGGGGGAEPAEAPLPPEGAAPLPGQPGYYPPPPGMTTPTGGGWASQAPSYGPEPGLPSAGPPPAPAPYPSGGGAPYPSGGAPAEAPPEEAPPEDGEEGEGPEGEEGEEGAPRPAAPKAPKDNLPAHVPTGTTALLTEMTPWVKYALIAGGVLAVGAAIYFFVIKKKKPE